MTRNKISFIEKLFEAILWKSRLIILLAVIFGLIAAGALFLAGSYDIWLTIRHVIPTDHIKPDYNELLIGIIGAVDFYLIGIVLLIFSFGIYELFISQIDIARESGEEHNILEVASLDELKNKLIKVIIMVLIVTFFKKVLSTSFTTPLEILYFALAILAIAACFFCLTRTEKK